jgi:hypothetical protein
MVSVQVRAHDEVNITDSEPCGGKVLFIAIGIHHMPKGARRPRLVVADASVNQDILIGHLQEVTLDAEHQFARLIEKPWMQPMPIFLEEFLRQCPEKAKRLKECSLLFDDAMDRDIADLDLL